MGEEIGGVEELAWLVKDNLYSKHLVLSVEEMFVEFLQPGSISGEEVLELKPMESYQRMLLHRLADLFGLAHESVGENEGRHLLVERVEESQIPEVLVADVLSRSFGYVPSSSHGSRRLLKHDVSLRSLVQRRDAVFECSTLSVEERQAAYFSARQRIFGGGEDGGKARLAGQRPVPAVARRMIAHALGKPVRLDPEVDASLACRGDGGRDADMIEASVSSVVDVVHSDSSKRDNHSPATAAKRMLTQALGFSVLLPSHRNPSKQVQGSPVDSCRIEAIPVETASPIPEFSDSQKVASGDCGRGTLKNLIPSASVVEMHTKIVPDDRHGVAAGRMFGQALGLSSNRRGQRHARHLTSINS